MKNESGIYPAANRVLIRQESVVKEDSKSLIEIPEWVEAKADQSQVIGVLVAVGPDAFLHTRSVTTGPDGSVVEITQSGYSKPFADVGDRILFAKFSGQRVMGVDGEKYILTNDEDITAKVSDDFDIGVLDPRQRAGRTREDD